MAPASSTISPAHPRAEACTVSFLCHGARIAVARDSPGVAELLRGILPPGATPVPAGEADVVFRIRRSRGGERGGARYGHYDVYEDEQVIARDVSLSGALGLPRSALHFAVACHARDVLFVHAGVVAWRGRAILIPGRSMSGKSTLVDAFVRAGATYYSDEYAVVDETGRVRAYPKPLRLRGGAPIAREATGPAEAADLPPLEPGLVVSTRFEPGGGWGPRRLSPGETMLRLVANTVLARVDPALTLRLLTPIAASTPGLESPRGEARETVERILARLR
jgi:hypothetical protein